LDLALSFVGGVVVAKRCMDVTTGRGGGGAHSAGFGDLSGAAGECRNLGLGDKAKKQISAEVKTASFTSQGSLSADSIRAVVEKNIRGVKACYEKALTQQPDLQGKVVVRFTIGPEGKITDFSIEESTMGSKEVEGCILSRMRRWEFPKPDQGPVTVSYPFIFTASG
jgi:TonB family protein